MTAGSPPAFLLWAILACTFQLFMTVHLWAYDRFKCLKWSSGRQPGAFKRVMTYSYVATVPMMVFFSVAITVIKYKESYIVLQDGDHLTIYPRPIASWSVTSRHWLVPLYFVLSFAWAFELVTHLEEFTFWLFLLHQGPSKRLWFRSWEFRVWYLGSMVAVLGMPLVTLIKRKDLEACLSWIFLSGSSAGAATTIGFLYVLARFPGFIRQVKAEGAEPDVVVRLATFFHMNIVRVIFRFFFNIPLLVIGVDGISGPYPILSHSFWADALFMVGGIGCFVSSALTLLVFFPRSVSRETGYTAARVIAPPPGPFPNLAHRPTTTSLPRYHLRDPSLKFPVTPDEPFQFPSPGGSQPSLHHQQQQQHYHHRHLSDDELSIPDVVDIEHGQGLGESIDMTRSPAGFKSAAATPVEPSGREELGGMPSAVVHPYVMSFTSPIDLCDEDDLPQAI